MSVAATTVSQLYQDMLGIDCEITSGDDGDHMVGSKHYEGLALDFRIRTIEQRLQGPVAIAVREALGDEYDVVLEATHLHVEYHP